MSEKRFTITQEEDENKNKNVSSQIEVPVRGSEKGEVEHVHEIGIAVSIGRRIIEAIQLNSMRQNSSLVRHVKLDFIRKNECIPSDPFAK